MRFVHPLHGGALSADVAGLLGARLGGLISLDLPVSPGFVLGTAVWHLFRLYEDGRHLPATVAEEVHRALEELDVGLLAVRAAPATRDAAPGPPVLDVGLSDSSFEALAARTSLGYARRSYRALELPRATRSEQLDAALSSILERATGPTAVIVQARTFAEGKPPSGQGRAFSRDPLRGTVWPTGEFRSGRSVMSLDALSRWVPPVGVQLRSALSRAESLHRSVCEVNFTVEAGRLWIDDARRVRHSRAADESIAEAGLTPAPAAGLGS